MRECIALPCSQAEKSTQHLALRRMLTSISSGWGSSFLFLFCCVCVCCSSFLFKSWREVEFFNCFFYTCGDDLSFCFWFWSVDMVKYNDFSIAEPTLHSWDKHIYNSLSFLNIAGFNVLTFYSRFLCPCSWQMGL